MGSVESQWVAGASHATARSAARRPKVQKTAGVTPRPRTVEVIRPPTMTMATGIEDFLAGVGGRVGSLDEREEVDIDDERDQRDAGGEGRHEDRDEPFEGAALDHRAGESLALVFHQVEVVGDHHDGVARRDAGDGDEPDEGGDADVVERVAGVEDAADEGEIGMSVSTWQGEDEACGSSGRAGRR